MLEKCRYFNDHRTAAALMIDDLSLTATTLDGKLSPGCDWGYGLAGKDSLYAYLRGTLLSKFPEIKGTYFFPILRHATQNQEAGYRLLFRDMDAEFIEFLAESSRHFELAYHGTDHGKFLDPRNPSFANWKHEFEMLRLGDAERLVAKLRETESFLGVKFTGGKYPGYRIGPEGPAIVEALGFKWWASKCDMLNHRHPGNRHSYLPVGTKILDMPTNFCGDAFNPRLELAGNQKGPWARIKSKFAEVRMESHLEYLYDNGLIISVQEHFQNLRTDGRRQTPNVFDDLLSLERIYGFLRSGDVWHATCSQIAQYLEHVDHSKLISLGEKEFSLEYAGNWGPVSLSLKSDAKRLLNLETGHEHEGAYKNGRWIFNGIGAGKYRFAGQAK